MYYMWYQHFFNAPASSYLHFVPAAMSRVLPARISPLCSLPSRLLILQPDLSDEQEGQPGRAAGGGA